MYINVAVICRIALQWRRQWLNDGGGLERLEEAFGIQSMEPAETISVFKFPSSQIEHWPLF
jgi:hypothetical protein